MHPNERISKDRYYLNIAADVSKRSTCLRRQYGAVIVNKDEIISTGYNGAPRKMDNCSDTGVCIRQLLNCEPGTHYEYCRAVHAEANAIISTSRDRMYGATLYLAGFDLTYGLNMDTLPTLDNPVLPTWGYSRTRTKSIKPCSLCAMLIANAGIGLVVCIDEHSHIHEFFPTYLLNENDRKLMDMAAALSR